MSSEEAQRRGDGRELSDEEIEALIQWCQQTFGRAEVATMLAAAIEHEEGQPLLYEVEGRIAPPLGGEHRTALLTRTPSTEAAVARFVRKFNGMGRLCVGLPEVRPAHEYLIEAAGYDSLAELREELRELAAEADRAHREATPIPIEEPGEHNG